jgi:hypothetical protein
LALVLGLKQPVLTQGGRMTLFLVLNYIMEDLKQPMNILGKKLITALLMDGSFSH